MRAYAYARVYAVCTYKPTWTCMYVHEAADGSQRVVDSITMLETASCTTASASTQVASTAEELAMQSEQIKTTIDTYLQEMAAA